MTVIMESLNSTIKKIRCKRSDCVDFFSIKQTICLSCQLIFFFSFICFILNVVISSHLSVLLLCLQYCFSALRYQRLHDLKNSTFCFKNLKNPQFKSHQHHPLFLLHRIMHRPLSVHQNQRCSCPIFAQPKSQFSSSPSCLFSSV